MSKETENIQLYSKVAQLIELARRKVASVVNLTMVNTYFEIGRMIVEDEQSGKERAAYGKMVLIDLAVQLTEKFGKGFSEPNLRNMRKLFLVYSDRVIQQKASTELQSTENKQDTIWQKPSTNSQLFTLSWSHYLILMRIEI